VTILRLRRLFDASPEGENDRPGKFAQHAVRRGSELKVTGLHDLPRVQGE